MVRFLSAYDQCGENTERAYEIARPNHDGQTIKGIDTPFIAHPVSVAAMAASMGYPEKVVEAGLLHDVIEKGSETTETLKDKGVGLVVVKAVSALTVEKEPLQTDEDYNVEKHKAWLEEFYRKTRRNSIARVIRPLDQKDRYLRSNEKRFLDRSDRLMPHMPSPSDIEVYIAARRYLK